jgi:hypothetical protein
MATKLMKPVVRELIASGNIAGKNLGMVIATIEPPDMITFRMKGRRIKYTVSLHNCMTLAFANYLQEHYRFRMEMYDKKKKDGWKVKKPRKPNIMVFNPVILKALKLI